MDLTTSYRQWLFNFYQSSPAVKEYIDYKTYLVDVNDQDDDFEVLKVKTLGSARIVLGELAQLGIIPKMSTEEVLSDSHMLFNIGLLRDIYDVDNLTQTLKAINDDDMAAIERSVEGVTLTDSLDGTLDIDMLLSELNKVLLTEYERNKPDIDMFLNDDKLYDHLNAILISLDESNHTDDILDVFDHYRDRRDWLVKLFDKIKHSKDMIGSTKPIDFRLTDNQHWFRNPSLVDINPIDKTVIDEELEHRIHSRHHIEFYINKKARIDTLAAVLILSDVLYYNRNITIEAYDLTLAGLDIQDDILLSTLHGLLNL